MWKIHHSAIVENVVVYENAKFGNDELWNGKSLVGRKSNNNNNIHTKNNNNYKNNVRSAWRRFRV